MAKIQRVRMRTQYAGPHGTAGPGKTIDLPEKEAAQLIKEGYAVDADAAEQSPEDRAVSDAVRRLYGRHTADELADMADKLEISIESSDTKTAVAEKIVLARKELGHDLIEGASEGDTDPDGSGGDTDPAGNSGDGDPDGSGESGQASPRDRELAPE